MGIDGRIHSIETLGALDGQGIRTVFFLQGCPMRCKYCHNPDTWEVGAKAEIMTPEQLLAFALRYKNYYGDDGGVTLSGGEPLLQEEFCLSVIKLLHKNGINVAIDTGGSVFAPRVYDVADLVILDIKHADAEVFKKLTGAENTNLLKTLEYLKAKKINFWTRQVIVEGFTDDENEVRAFKKMSEGASKIELLAYHSMGIIKWQDLKLDYELKNVAPPTQEHMRILEQLIK